jgi:PA14 domain
MARLPQRVLVLALVMLIAAALRAQESPQPGLLTVMFESIEFTRPTGLEMMPDVNVDTGWKVNDYSRIWIGRIKSPASGQVEFFAEADDGLRLSIGGRRIIDGWGPDTPRSATVTAQKDQLLPLRLEYFQNGGTGFVRLHWSWPGQPRQLIPASAFSHTPADREEIERVMKAGGPIVPKPVPPAPPDSPDRSLIYVPGKKYPTTSAADVLPARPGPHLFVDDYLIASAQNLTRVIQQPRRDSAIPNPIVTAKQDQTFQPYLTVSRSPETGRFRMWYGAWTPDQNTSASDLAYIESDDGVNWIRPHRILPKPGPLQFGSEVLDRGPYWPDQSQRYVYSFWYGGLRLSVSPDGLHFTQLVDRPVLPHNHDIDSISWDPLRQRYVATISTFTQHPRFKGARRTTMQSFSQDLLNWTPPAFVLIADDSVDEGETQFYAMEGYINRGPLRIGMVKILRDDLFSDTPEVLKQRGADFGIGYTTLAWTRDGEHWVRDREAFFDRGPIGSWDRSHAWIDEQVIVGDQVHLYYGGYRSGHKANRFAERQIGLVRMPLDRYVARQAGEQPAALLTIPLKLDEHSTRLLINADAPRGEIRVQLRDATTNAVIDGMGFTDCRAISGDNLRARVLWGDDAQTRRKLSALSGRSVQLEFALKNAGLFSFEFVEAMEHE